KFTYTQVQNAEGRTDLVVTFDGETDRSLTLKDFRDGDFAIRLRGSVSAPQDPVRTFHGDKQNWDSDPGQDGIQPAPDGFGNYVRADGEDGRPDIALAERADEFFGSTAEEVERFTTAGGNDIVRADGATGATGGADLVEAGAGRDIVWAGPGADFVEGGSDGLDGAEVGGDVVNAGAGDDAVYGRYRIELTAAVRAGESELSANEKGDFLSGGDGNDRLIGASERDALLGGAGEDLLVGGAGEDNLFGDLPYGANGHGWTVTRTITPLDGLLRYAVEFSGGVLEAPIPEGAGDALYAGAGADWSFGGDGDDFIDAGSGDDVSSGEAGADILIGGAGDDFLIGDSGPGGTSDGGDYLDGGAGNDTLQADGGDDVLIGGPGIDFLAGGTGRDIYVFNRGDGTDTVFDTADDDPANVAERSIVVAGDGINRNDVKFRTGSLVIDFGPADPNDPGSARDAVHFAGFDQTDPANTPLIGEIRFADGSSMSYADILAQGFDVDGSEANDDGQDADHPQLVGTGVVDRVRGFGGDDLLFGLAGDDALDGGAGADQIVGGAGNDAIDGGEGADIVWADEDNLAAEAHGADTVSGGPGNDSIRGYGGDDRLAGGEDDDYMQGDAGADALAGDAGADSIWGGSGDDRLDGGEGADLLQGEDGADRLTGGAGEDVLDGGTGDDLYVFNLGDGRDTVRETGDTALDQVSFGEAIAPADLMLWQTGADLVIGHSNGADALAIANWYAGAQYRVAEFAFADGSVWTQAYAGAEGEKTRRGTAGDDTIGGASFAETIEGLAGDDTLYGNGGADTLSGGAGDDLVFGGDGADTFRFELGDGVDRIQESGLRDDTLIFGAGIARADVAIERIGNDLVFSHANGTDEVIVQSWYAHEFSYQLQTVTFAAGGTSLAWYELSSLGTNVDHQYAFNLGDGEWTIEDWGGADALTFGAGIAKADIQVARDGADLAFSHSN
ncbi:MAG: hypothetical protein EPN19_00600, partial [Betaproteobacteria bacterium]